MNRLQTLLKMAADKPEDVFLKYAIALEHVSLNDYEAAEKTFEWLVSKHPNYLPTYYQYGQLLDAREQKEKALKIYTEGIALAATLRDYKTARELQQAMELLQD